MAKAKMNPVMENMSGAIGDLVFRRRAGQVVVSRKADISGRVLSAGQLNHMERFRQATFYAKASLADSSVRPIYETLAKTKDKPAFALAVGDYLNAPSVDAIDLAGYTGKAGEKIVIRASDDIEVIAVSVAIRDSKGVVEQGSAAFEQGYWRYTTQTAVDLAAGSVAVDVTAVDRPGNKTMKTQVKS
jgi:hypothetical protein